jgi:hypothetical protein
LLVKIRKVCVSLAAVGSLALLVACGDNASNGSSASPTPSPTPNAGEQLTASTKDFGTTGYKFTLKAPANAADVSGSFDPAANNLTATTNISVQGLAIKFELVAIGGNYYAKLAGIPISGVSPTKWLHLDIAKLKGPEAVLLADFKDPTGVQTLSGAIVSAEKTGDRTYKGTMDLTKAKVVGVTAEDVKDMGDAAKSIPFEATLDDKGRLATLKLTVPAGGSTKADTLTFAYSDFGATVTATKPAASETIEAPPAVYTLLNS